MRLQYPIVLIQGLGALSKYGPIDYYYGWPKRLKDAGNQVLCTSATSFHSIEHRAKQIQEQIDATFPSGKVNLLGHSMGGLDARYLVSKLGFGTRAASVTVVGTPNRGSFMSDLLQQVVPQTAVTWIEKMAGKLGMSTEGLKQVSAQYVRENFNESVPDIEGVKYFSAATIIRGSVKAHALPIFWASHKLLKQLEGDNDGFVSLRSAKWGKHIVTDCGDHYSQIGQPLGHTRGLDYLAFQDKIIAALIAEGL